MSAEQEGERVRFARPNRHPQASERLRTRKQAGVLEFLDKLKGGLYPAETGNRLEEDERTDRVNDIDKMKRELTRLIEGEFDE